MNTIVNKNDLINAHRAKQLVTPAFYALQKIDLQAVDGNKDALQKITAFACWLEKFVLQADAVIEQAKDQIRNQPKNVINVLVLRTFLIHADIELEQVLAKHKTEAHGIKVVELMKKGFGEPEILGLLQHQEPYLVAHFLNAVLYFQHTNTFSVGIGLSENNSA